MWSCGYPNRKRSSKIAECTYIPILARGVTPRCIPPAGLSVSEFQRRACLSGKVVVEEDRRVNVEAVRQLLAIGNNLNQLTKSGYIHQAIDRDSLRYVLGQVGSIVDELIS